MDFCKSCEELHAVSRIPLTIVHQEGEVRLALPAGHEELISHRALTWVLADFVLQKRDALHPLVTYVEPGYFIGVVALPDDCYCIAGLVSRFSTRAVRSCRWRRLRLRRSRCRHTAT